MSTKKSLIKRLNLILVLIIALIICFFISACGNKDNNEDGSIAVSTSAQLKNISNGLDKSYHLTKDIDMAGVEWSPAGTPANMFTGVLDGKGFTVSNLAMTASGNNGGGLIGVLGESGTVKNLKISVNLAGGNIMGAIAAISYGKIVDCEASGTVSRSLGESLGGIVGRALGGEIKGCKSTVAVAGNMWIGGIAGYSEISISDCVNEGTVAGNIRVGGIAGEGRGADGCTNKSDIISTSFASTRMGGIIGSSIGANKIVDCNQDGVVRSPGDYIGGIVGHSEGAVENCVVKDKGTVDKPHTVEGNLYVGGIAGRATGAVYIENDVSVSGTAYVGGVAGRLDGSAKDCANNGTVLATGVYTEDSAGYHMAFLGGIAGMTNQPAENCINRGSVNYPSGAGARVGGIFGFASNAVTACVNEGEVNSNSASKEVGGIVGYMFGRSTNIAVSQCENKAKVKGGESVGGIVGFVNAAYITQDYSADNPIQVFTLKISECVNRGAVEGTANYVGGIAGLAYGIYKDYVSTSAQERTQKVLIEACQNKGAVSGNDYIAGICGQRNDFASAKDCTTDSNPTASGANWWPLIRP